MWWYIRVQGSISHNFSRLPKKPYYFSNKGFDQNDSISDVRQYSEHFGKKFGNSREVRRLAVFLNIQTSVPNFHIISTKITLVMLKNKLSHFYMNLQVHYYDVMNITSQLAQVTAAMLPHFSSQPGAYYSDALFFISLGLHRVAPLTQSRAILLDVDIKLVDDIAQLFQEFNKWVTYFSTKLIKPNHNVLLALQPPLTPSIPPWLTHPPLLAVG